MGIAAATAMLLVAGCPGSWWIEGPSGGDTGDPSLRTFKSSDEMLGFFREQANARLGASYGLSRGWGVTPGALFFAVPAAQAAGGAETATDGLANEADDDGTAYSTTNIQEAGVDESDVIKSNGTQFFIAKDRTVRIVQAVPATNMAEVGRIELAERVGEMYLYGSTLIVISQRYFDPTLPALELEGDEVRELMTWPPYWPVAKIVVTAIDVSVPTVPVTVGEIELDGVMVSSRLTNDRIYLVLTITPAVPVNPTPLTFALMELDDVLPKATTDGVEQNAIGWEDYYRPVSADGCVTTALVTLDAADVEHIVGSLAVMADAGTIYASQDALYITDDEWDAADGYRRVTAVHKFVFDEDVGARYVGSGAVPGRLLNQFSLGEYDGYLRVATHVDGSSFFRWGDGIAIGVSTAWGRGADGVADTDTAVSDGNTSDSDAAQSAPAESTVTGPYNGVYVLGEGDGQLDVVGSVENLAPSERLYAARFVGSRGFLVTFKQIDPLFTLDLSEPTQPAVVGELKIPGYSDYLHPFGEDLLIGVGRSTATTAWGATVQSALQLSLFDVSDLANPTVVQQIEVGGYGSYSDVSWDHKALVFLPEQGLLGLTAALTNGDTVNLEYAEPSFEGALCYRVTAAGFEALGNVAAVNTSEWWRSWRRVAFIGETAYALTEDGVRAAPLSDFTASNTLELEEAE